MAGKKAVRAAVVSHKGCVRGNNEDNFFFNGDFMLIQDMNEGAVIEHAFSDKFQVFGIFDGMGGGDSGERASSIATQILQNYYLKLEKGDVLKTLKEYAYKANDIIVEDGKKCNADSQGTTMAVLVLKGDQAYVSNVGDSRIYLLRDGALSQLSMDHSVVGQLVREGRLTEEQARKSPNNNIITNFLGMPPEEMVSKFVYQITDKAMQGDRFLICSDGLCDMLSNASIRKELMSYAAPGECARQLVLTAMEMGGKDNVTCMIIDIGEFQTLPCTDKETKADSDLLEDGEDDENTVLVNR